MVALVKCPDLLHPKSSVLMSGFNGASTLSCLSHPYFEKDTLQLKHFFRRWIRTANQMATSEFSIELLFFSPQPNLHRTQVIVLINL